MKYFKVLCIVVYAYSGTVDAVSLSNFNIDNNSITVSGISSGGNMAVQLHVAYSQIFSGVGVIAAGPYHCAASTFWPNVMTATNYCLDLDDLIPFWGPPQIDHAVASARREAGANRIDPLNGMQGDRVYLFSGNKDTVVPTSVMDSLKKFYVEVVDGIAIKIQKDVEAGHAMVTEDFGTTECAATASPFINDCDFDLAGELLNFLYDDSQPPITPVNGQLVEFDQRPFLDGAVSMNAKGHVYVPKACEDGETCRLHVALHGCLQHQEVVGDAFYRHVGYNRWAEANNIIVLYPQAVPYTREAR